MITSALPVHLVERIETLNAAEPRSEGEFVLYWAHHALRAHQNPALETAAHLALSLNKPLLVYQGLGGRHRYNSDRHHRFILECARDFHDELCSLGLDLHFHLPQDPLEPGPLRQLLSRAAVAVSELYPVPPFTAWYQQHANRHPDLPFHLVDASLLLPMTSLQKAPTRAFQFRRSHRDEIDRRVQAGWPQIGRWPEAFKGDPGFERFDLQEPLDAVIAGCRIDHSIPAVTATQGGTKAGYQRWAGFLEDGLASYHRLRNDAALPESVSRMSAYIHYGCVSPFRIAADAAAAGGEGAEKFLDEFLVWRELSHHFCFHTPELESFQALPGWAAESLIDHQQDSRTETYDWETLARGQTDETLWDLAQRSLLRQGELHNNLRMTWGKSFLRWAQRPQRALKLMIDLNHRYALDGSDPNSYGGLLWCMGQFDRAFPPGPIFGKVRQRSIPRHAKRMDVGMFARWASRPACGRKLRVAVVGAGLAGLTAARTLADQGHDVVVVEKARGPGGRMSTRRQHDLSFDHGAQYFTARDPRFLRHVLAWRERGLVEDWEARIAAMTRDSATAVDTSEPRFVAIPGMNGICRDMVSDLDSVHFGWHASSLNFDDGRWLIEAENGDQLASDALIVTTPPDQARALLQNPDINRKLTGVEMAPCWAVMAEFDHPLFEDWDAAFVNEGPLSWISGQSSRPGRGPGHGWVLHAGPDWSQQNLEADREFVIEHLLQAMRQLPGANAVETTFASAHRWRYALAKDPLQVGALEFPSQNLVVAGAWCHGSRVEGAFLSGVAAAGRVMASAA